MSQSKQIARFFRNLIIFCLVFFAADRLIGTILKTLYFSLKKGQYAQTTYSVDSAANKDIIVFGSSRAVRHYCPSLIQKELGLSCYNVGRDGEFMPYYTAVQDVILQKSKPKFIILDANVWEFAPNNEKYEKLSILLPYVPSHPELKKYINEISKWEFLKLNSLTYLFNSTVFISLHDFILANKLVKDDNGYLPLDREVPKQEFEDYKERKSVYDKKREKANIPIDYKAVGYYRAFLDKTKKLNIPTYVIISPTILKEPSTKEKLLIEQIAKEYPNVKFIDYSSDTTYNEKYQKFADSFHLNTEGSKEFTNDLIRKLKQELIVK